MAMDYPKYPEVEDPEHEGWTWFQKNVTRRREYKRRVKAMKQEFFKKAYDHSVVSRIGDMKWRE